MKIFKLDFHVRTQVYYICQAISQPLKLKGNLKREYKIMKIVIVGGGIIGLTTGLYLKKTFKDLDDVTIVTDKITPNTTADGAAGIWGIYLLTDTPIEQQK